MCRVCLSKILDKLNRLNKHLPDHENYVMVFCDYCLKHKDYQEKKRNIVSSQGLHKVSAA